MVCVSRLRAAVGTFLVLLLAARAHAATVAMVRPDQPSPSFSEVLSRLQGELLSVGIEVEMISRPELRGPAGTATRAWLERLAADRELDAIIEVVGAAVPVAVDVWLAERSTRKLAPWRVDAEPNTANPSERLSIRALEVLRSRFLELDLAARQGRGDVIEASAATHLFSGSRNGPSDSAEWLESDRGPSVEAGGAVVTSLDGVGAALMPVLGLGWGARAGLGLQISLAGLGSRPTVAAAAGNARIGQQYGLLGGSFRFRSARTLWPFIGLSAGVLRTSLAGHALSPRQGHALDQWSFLLDGSLGAGLSLGRRYYLTLAAHVQAAAPYVAVHFADDVVATSGRPNLVLTLTAGAWL